MADNPDLTPAVGIWFSTKPETDDIEKLELTVEGDQLMVAPESADGPWGKASAVPCSADAGSSVLTGYHCSIERESETVMIAANLKYGILVIQAYHTPKNGGRSYFTREFFSLKNTQPRECAPPADGEAEFIVESDRLNGADAPGPIELTYFVGSWRNINPVTGTIFDFEISEEDGDYWLQPRGVGSPREWERVRITPVSVGCGSNKGTGFFARYDLGFMEMELAANENQGIIIIASYSIFKDDSGRANYFRREFFYKE